MRKNRTYRLYCPQYDINYQSMGKLGSVENFNDLMAAQHHRYGRYSYIETWEDYKKVLKSGSVFIEGICRI